MSERKNIDKLFQEKFKDFEVAPSDDVWPYLENKLKEKKDRKVIPFWWKLSGIAAALLLGLILTKSLFDQKSRDIENGVVISVHEKPTGESQDSAGNAIVTQESAPSNVASENLKTDDHDLELVNKSRNRIANSENTNVAQPHKITSDSGLVSNVNKFDRNKAGESTNNRTNRQNGTHRNSDLQLVNNKNSDTPKTAVSKLGGQIVKSRQKTSGITSMQPAVAQKSLQKESGHLKATQKPDKDEAHPSTKNEMLRNLEMQNPNAKLTLQNQKQEVPASVKNSNPTTDSKPNPIAATEVLSPNKKTDSTAIATVVPNALEELLNEKENNWVTKGPQINRWQITSSVAPIYFGSTSGGSPIDTAFVGNSKDYKTNLSIRLGVNYAINKKLSIRTGVSNVTFDYNTNDVLISAGMERSSLGNINTTGQNQFLHFGTGRRAATENVAATSNLLTTDEFPSYLNQRMSYIEVPLELSYAVIDKKVGITIIGGVSTLFLNENQIVVVSDGLTSNLGEANNLNKTHFSTNIGLGVRYRFYKSFQVNFEPMFKYQINTFSNDAGNFKPYYFGLYTGLSYSF